MLIKFNASGTHIKENCLKVRVDYYPEPGTDLYVIYGETPCLIQFILVDEDIKSNQLENYIKQVVKDTDIASMNDYLLLSDSAHYVSPHFRDKCKKEKKEITGTPAEVIAAVNAELEGFEIEIASGGEKKAIKPKSIDVGPGAIARAAADSVAKTVVVKDNPANADGSLDTWEFYFATNASNVECATFYVVSGNNLSTRDTETIGSVTGGSKQTFTGCTTSVVTGDYAGYYWSAGNSTRDTSGYAGFWGILGDQIPCTNYAFTSIANYTYSIYATGTETGGGETYEVSCTDGFKAGEPLVKGQITMGVAVTDGLKGGDLDAGGLFFNVLAEDGGKIGEHGLGAATTETLRPNANGDETNLTSVNSPNNYQSVDEETPDSDFITPIGGGSTWKRDLYGITGLTGTPASISQVEVFIYGYDEGYDYTKICIKTGGTVYESDPITITGSETKSKVWAINPQSGLAWTKADIEALQAGISLWGSSLSSSPAIEQVYVVVSYVPLVDYPSISYAANPAAADGLKLSETLATLLEANQAAGDGFKIADSPITQAVLNALSGDGFKLSESLAAGLLYSVLASEGVKVGDGGSIYLSITRAVAEGIRIGESLSSILRANAGVLEGIRLGDSGAAQRIAELLAADGVKVSDGGLGGLVYALTLAEGLTLGDSVALQALKVIALTLLARSLGLTLNTRTRGLTLRTRSTSLTLPVRE